MSPAARVFLTITALLAVIVCMMIGLGWWYWAHNGDEIMRTGKQAWAQGSADGARLDEAGCLSEAMNRLRQDPPAQSLAASMAGSMRLRACLKASRVVGDFCAGVPAPDSIIQTVTWSRHRCDALGAPGQDCASLMQDVGNYCASKQRAAKIRR